MRSGLGLGTARTSMSWPYFESSHCCNRKPKYENPPMHVVTMNAFWFVVKGTPMNEPDMAAQAWKAQTAARRAATARMLRGSRNLG